MAKVSRVSEKFTTMVNIFCGIFWLVSSLMASMVRFSSVSIKSTRCSFSTRPMTRTSNLWSQDLQAFPDSHCSLVQLLCLEAKIGSLLLLLPFPCYLYSLDGAPSACMMLFALRCFLPCCTCRQHFQPVQATCLHSMMTHHYGLKKKLTLSVSILRGIRSWSSDAIQPYPCWSTNFSFVPVGACFPNCFWIFNRQTTPNILPQNFPATYQSQDSGGGGPWCCVLPRRGRRWAGECEKIELLPQWTGAKAPGHPLAFFLVGRVFWWSRPGVWLDAHESRKMAQAEIFFADVVHLWSAGGGEDNFSDGVSPSAVFFCKRRAHQKENAGHTPSLIAGRRQSRGAYDRKQSAAKRKQIIIFQWI